MNSYQLNMSLRLIQLRREWHMNKKEVALRCNIKYREYLGMEKGDRLPNARDVVNLCKLYRWEPNRFLYFD